VRNRDVLRQARIMRALHGRPGVRVPDVLLADDGVPPFFVMEFVAGQAYEPRKDIATRPPTPDTVRRRARAAARMLACLQSLSPAELGVEERAMSLGEELERWSRLFATAGDDLRHDESDVYRRLAQTVPPPVAPCILHGDYRLGNLQFDGDELSAIIDWELWSVGDPRTDLAWLMAWSDPVHRFVTQRDAANQAAADAIPPGRELLASYKSVRDVDTAQLDWFLAYCYYKLASTMAVLAKRNRRLADPDPGLELAGATVPAALARARELLAAALP
jgi:aminoglycoside phosphotransferase (APT) family kinase protein